MRTVYKGPQMPTYIPYYVIVFFTLNIKPFFLPVGVKHTQCPGRFLLLERYKLYGHKTTTTQRNYIVMQSAEYWTTMTYHRTGYDRYDIQMLTNQMRSQREKTEETKNQIK